MLLLSMTLTLVLTLGTLAATCQSKVHYLQLNGVGLNACRKSDRNLAVLAILLPRSAASKVVKNKDTAVGLDEDCKESNHFRYLRHAALPFLHVPPIS